MPRNAISLPRLVATCWKIGNSARHGPHHDAHLLTTAGWPASPSMRLWNAFEPPSRIALDCSYRAASGAGAPASCALRLREVEGRRGLLGRRVAAGLGQTDDQHDDERDGGE